MGKISLRILQYMQAFSCSAIMVFSCALITAAIILKGTFSKYNAFLYYYGTVMTTIVLLGSIISIIIAIWGCYSSWKKSSSPQFTIILCVNLIAHIIISIIYISFLKKSLSESVETLFDEQILTYTQNPQPMDFAQISLQCCGKNEASDWFEYLPHIPASCCPEKINNETIACAIIDFPLIYHNGCIKEFETFTNPSVQLITTLFLGLQISEIVTLVISSLSCWHVLMDAHDDSHRIKKSRQSDPQIPQMLSTHL